MSLNLYVPISKIDREKRMVWGYASTPSLDLQGERVALDAIKNALPDYMAWANIREMHQPSAVGVAKEATVDDKGLYVGSKIIDEDAWNKCLEGVYKGYSIGGERVKKEGDTITDLKLLEISLVDRPANPDCRIEVTKAAGTMTAEDKEAARQSVEAGAEHTQKAAPATAEPTFTREEVGILGRIINKLGFGKGGPAPAHDGFSLPARQMFQPDPLADERLANQRPLGVTGGNGGDVSVAPAGRSDQGGPGLIETDDEDWEIPEYEDGKAAGAGVSKKYIPDKVRQSLADKGEAMKDGSYPIRNKADLERAIRAFGRADNKAKVRSWIIRRAKELKATDMLPPDWPGSTKEEKTTLASSLEKSLCGGWCPGSNISRLAAVYDELISLTRSLRWEADAEVGDKKDYTQARKVSVLAQAVGTLLAEHAAEEVQEEKEREAARKTLVSAGITLETVTMTKSIFDPPGAAGAGGNGAGGGSEIAKRASEHAHKAHEHLKHAEEHHRKARECFMTAAGHFDHARHHADEIKKCVGKSESDPTLREHVEKLHHHLTEAHRHLAEHHHHHTRAGEHLHEAKKETEAWVGEAAEAPGAREGSFYKPEEGLTAIAQRQMTEGHVPEYHSDRPYHTGPSAGLDTDRVKGIVAEAIQPVAKQLTDAQAALAAANEARARAEGRAEAFAQMPAGAPRGRLFTVDKAAFPGATSSEPSEQEIMLEGVDLSGVESNPDAALKAAGRVQGNKIMATLTGRKNFARSMLDPSFQGAAGGQRR